MLYDNNLSSLKDPLKMSQEELISWAAERSYVEIPSKIESVEDMKNASELLLKLTSLMSYFSEQVARADAATRIAKKNTAKYKQMVEDAKGYSSEDEYKKILSLHKFSQEEQDDMIGRKTTLTVVLEKIKHNYQAISRAVTIHIENNRELCALNEK